MIYYTPEMFDINSIKKLNPELVMQCETLEFKLQQYQNNFDSFKKMYYMDLFVYERKKEHQPNIIPDKKVLQQIKTLENDDAVKEFRQNIEQLKREISNIENTLKNQATKIKFMFLYKKINLINYMNDLKLYFDGKMSFEIIMNDVFKNEFNGMVAYKEIHLQRNNEIMKLLVVKAPDEWKELFEIMYLEELRIQQEYDVRYIKENPDADNIQLVNHLYNEILKYGGKL